MQHIEELLNKERNFYDQKVSALINDIELIENASYLSEQEKKDKIRNYCNVLEKDTKCKIEVEFMIQLLKVQISICFIKVISQTDLFHNKKLTARGY